MSLMEADMLDLKQLADAALHSAMKRPSAPASQLQASPFEAPSLPNLSSSQPQSRAQTEGGLSENGEVSISRDPIAVENIDQAIFGLRDLISSLSSSTSETSALPIIDIRSSIFHDEPSAESTVERKVMYDQYKAQEQQREAEREALKKKAARQAEQEAMERQVSQDPSLLLYRY